MADRVGQQLGNYRLARLLGRGGFAEVYLGEHVYLKTQAAIKVLQTRLAEEEMDSFLTEAQTIARLEHPHIVHVFDFGLEDGTPFLVMSYAPNGTLRQRHPKGVPLPLPTIVSYIKQVTDALQYAHDQKLIHRDVKPENMLVGRGNEVLLSDFGIAVIAHSTRSQSVESAIGTVDYMAPEQIQGKPRPASDQYAFGVVVYEWLCGVRPFHGSPQEMYGQHLYARPTPLHEKVATISPEVEDVVMRALAKDPQERFARVQAFASALEDASLSAQPSAFASPGQPLEPPSQDQWTQTSDTDLPPSQWPQPTIAASQPNSQAQATSTTPPVSQWAQPTVAPPPRSVESQLPAMTSPSQPTIDPPSLPGKQSQFIDSDAPPGQEPELLLAQRQRAEKEQARKAEEERERQAASAFSTLGPLSVPLLSSDRSHVSSSAQPVVPGASDVNKPAQMVQRRYLPTRRTILLGGLVVAVILYAVYNLVLSATPKKWAFQTGGPVFSSPTVVTSVLGGGIVYVGSDDHYLYAIDATSGQKKWAFLTGGGVASSPTVANGIVYISSNGNLYAINRISGQQKWIFRVGGSASDDSPTVANGVVYVALDGTLYAVDATSGQQKWVFLIGGAISSSSPVVANGIVYVGSDNGKLYAIDAISGQQKWAFQTGSPGTSVEASPSSLSEKSRPPFVMVYW